MHVVAGLAASPEPVRVQRAKIEEREEESDEEERRRGGGEIGPDRDDARLDGGRLDRNLNGLRAACAHVAGLGSRTATGGPAGTPARYGAPVTSGTRAK